MSVIRRTISTPILLTLLLIAIALIAVTAGSRPFNQTVIDIFLRVILVVGLYIFIGNSGVMSFGHIGFTCLGGYAAAWLTIPPMMKQTLLPGLPDWLMNTQLPYWAGAIFAALWAALWAAMFGKILMRLSGIAASIATFAMLAMINTVYSNWEICHRRHLIRRWHPDHPLDLALSDRRHHRRDRGVGTCDLPRGSGPACRYGTSRPPPPPRASISRNSA